MAAGAGGGRAPFSGLTFGQPLSGPWAKTSPFNAPRNYSAYGGKVNDKHEGVDVAPVGTATAYVLAVADGVVEAVKVGAGYGNYVIVRSIHNGREYRAWRAHMASVAVTVGQTVKRGDVLGVCGSTGNSTGRHDHLTMTSPGGMSGYIVANVIDPTPYYPPSPPDDRVDLLPYLRGDGRLYEVRHPSGATETFQTQAEPEAFYLVKNSQWEELYAGPEYIWRGVDTSPGASRFYIQFEPGMKRARWTLRHMRVGQTWIGPGHQVQFYDKATCAPSAANSGNATNRMTFVARYAARTWNGVTVPDVVELTNGSETWFYARGFGLVAWSAGWGQSAIVQVYAPGERPNLVRERLNCQV